MWDVHFVRELGADEVVDYTRVRFEDVVGAVDALLDAVGGETLARSWAVLKAGGRLVSIASEDAVSERDRAAFLLVRRDGEQLREIGRAIRAGRLRVLVKAVAPWAQAGAAFLGTLAVPAGEHGKVVVAFGEGSYYSVCPRGRAAAATRRPAARKPSATKPLVHSLPLPGAAAMRGPWRISNQRKNISARARPAARSRMPVAMLRAVARKATPVRTVQKRPAPSHAGTSVATNGRYSKC